MAFRISGIRLRKMDYGTKMEGSWLHMVKEIRATGYPWCSTFPIFQHFAAMTMGDGSRSRNTDLKISFKILNDGKPASIQLLLDNETEQGEWYTLNVVGKTLREVKEDLDMHRFLVKAQIYERDSKEVEEDPFEAIAEQMKVEKEKKLLEKGTGLKEFEDEESAMIKARNKARKGKD